MGSEAMLPPRLGSRAVAMGWHFLFAQWQPLTRHWMNSESTKIQMRKSNLVRIVVFVAGLGCPWDDAVAVRILAAVHLAF